MQLGMIGAGRTGANMSRRLRAWGPVDADDILVGDDAWHTVLEGHAR